MAPILGIVWLVNKNGWLTDVVKFNYLKSLLYGPAQSVVAGLALTSANYQRATEYWKKKICKSSSGNFKPYESFNKNTQNIFTSKIKKLRHLYDTVEANVHGLESMEIMLEMYGCFLTPVLLQILPEELRIVITRNLESETWELKDILKDWRKSCKLESNVYVVKIQEINQPRIQEVSCHILLLHCILIIKNNTPLCGAHIAIEITVVQGVTMWQALKPERISWEKRERSGHLSWNCQNPVKCFKCQGSHYVSLCSKNEQRKNTKSEEENKQQQ